jgi:hypothetical protein
MRQKLSGMNSEATGSAEGDVDDRDTYRDHFIALRRIPRRWLGRCLWFIAHALAVLAASALFVAVIALSLLIFGTLFKLGVPGLLTESSAEDVEVAKQSVPLALKGVIVFVPLTLISLAALWGLLKLAGRQIPPTFRLQSPVPPPKRRETRREFAKRARRRGWRDLLVLSLVAAVAGSTWITLGWPELEPWQPGISVLARVGRAILALILGISVILIALALFMLLTLVLMIAGWIRSGLAPHVLPPRARTPEEADQPARPARRSLPVLGREPSPSLLVYLFADRLLPSDTALKLGAPVPCSDAEVTMSDLVATSFAAAFWGLRGRGALELEAISRRRLLWTKRRIEVRRVRAEQARGLEGAVMSVPNIDPEAYVGADTTGEPGPLGDVRQVVQTWFGGLSEDPEWSVISTVLEEGQARGLVATNQDEPELRLRCSAISSQQDAFTRFKTSWQQFQQREGQLHALLVRECRKAIKGAREHPEGRPLQAAIGFAMQAQSRATRPWPKPS